VPNDTVTSPSDFDADNNEPLAQASEETVQSEAAAQQGEIDSDDDSTYGSPEARGSMRANRGVHPDRLVNTESAVINTRSDKVFAIRQDSFDEQTSIERAFKREDAQEWLDAVNEEFESLLRGQSCDIAVYTTGACKASMRACASRLNCKEPLY
jgi:hypothetical protein